MRLVLPADLVEVEDPGHLGLARVGEGGARRWLDGFRRSGDRRLGRRVEGARRRSAGHRPRVVLSVTAWPSGRPPLAATGGATPRNAGSSSCAGPARRVARTDERVEVAQLEQPPDREQVVDVDRQRRAEPGVVGRQELAVRRAARRARRSRRRGSSRATRCRTRRRSSSTKARSSRLARMRMRSAGTFRATDGAVDAVRERWRGDRADPSADSLLPGRRPRRPSSRSPADTPRGYHAADAGNLATTTSRQGGRAWHRPRVERRPPRHRTLPPLLLEGQGPARPAPRPGWRARSAASPG